MGEETVDTPSASANGHLPVTGGGGHARDKVSTEAAPAALGHVAASGAAWMMISTILSKGATFVAQVLLGWWLTKEDFGMFATATAVAKLMAICQDAGARDLLVQRPAREYPELSGRVFWFAMAFNTGTGALILLAAWPLAHFFFKNDQISHLLFVMALGLPLMTPASILYCKLRLDFRFRSSSMVLTSSGLLRQLSTVLLAGVGVGVMSFAWPVVICAAFESATLWYLTKDAPWKRPAELKTWPALVGRTKWLIFGAVANMFLDQGPYLLLGPVLSRRFGETLAYNVTGLYFWAFQMTAQLGVLLSWNMQMVLTPIFARLNGDPKRQLRTALRSMSGLMMIGSVASLEMAVVMDPTEKLLFSGKWAGATPAVAVFGICFPFRILYGLTAALLIATGRTKAWCVTAFIEGLAFTLAAGAAALYTSDATALAWWSGGALALSRFITTVWVFRSLGADLRDTLVEMLWPWMLACLGAYCAWSVEDFLNLESVVHRTREVLADGETRFGVEILDGFGVAGWFGHAIQSFGLNAVNTARVIELARFGISGTLCALTFILLSRMLMGDVVRDTVRLLPARIRPLMARLTLVRL